MQHQTLEPLEFLQSQFDIMFSASVGIADDAELRGFTASKIKWFQTLRNKGLDLNQLVHTNGSAMLLDVLGYFNWQLPKEQQLRVFEVKLYWITALLSSGANPSVCDRRGRNALHIIALTVGKLEKKLAYGTRDHDFVHKHADFLCEGMTTLMSYGCDPMAEDENGWYPSSLYQSRGYGSFVLATALHAFEIAGSQVAEYSRVASAQLTGTSLPQSQLPDGIRQRNGYRFRDESSRTPEITQCVSKAHKNPNLPPQLADHYCDDECPYEWPISWRLFRHRQCPTSCKTTIRMRHEPGPRETLLRAYFQGEDWERLLVR